MHLIWFLVFKRRPLLPFSPLYGGSSGPKQLSGLFSHHPHFGGGGSDAIGLVWSLLARLALPSVDGESGLSLFSEIQEKLSLRGLNVVALCVLNPRPGSTVLSEVREKNNWREVTVVKCLCSDQAVIAQAALKLPILLPQPPWF